MEGNDPRASTNIGPRRLLIELTWWVVYTHTAHHKLSGLKVNKDRDCGRGSNEMVNQAYV